MNNLFYLAHAGDYTTTYDPMYGNGYDTTTVDSGTLAVIYAVILIVSAVLYALHAYLLGRIFKKAGVPAWKAWVPFYNSWVMLELGGQPGFWAVLAIIPLVNIAAVVFMYIAMYNIGLKLSKSGAFVLWGIFLPTVWYAWLAFDKSVWEDGKGAPAVTPVNPPHAAATAAPVAVPTEPAHPTVPPSSEEK